MSSVIEIELWPSCFDTISTGTPAASISDAAPWRVGGRQEPARRENIAGAAESYSSNADIDSFTSPAAVNRALDQAISDMATYTQLLIGLKKKGAAPWLLAQLQKAGPSRGSISLARKYLSDTNALKAVNAPAAQLTAVSGIYGQVTADPKWESSKAWSGGLSSAQTKTLNSTVQVTVTSEDANQKAREIARLTKHYTDAAALGAGI